MDFYMFGSLRRWALSQCRWAISHALLLIAEVKEAAYSLFPARILEATYIDPIGIDAVPLVQGAGVGAGNCNKGVYMIRMWSAIERREAHYLLSAAQLCKALGIVSPSSLWHLREDAIDQLFHAHVAPWHATHHEPLALLWHPPSGGTIDLRTALQRFRACLAIPCNLTADDVAIVYTFLAHGLSDLRQAAKKEDPAENRVVRVDFDLEETVLRGRDWLVESP